MDEHDQAAPRDLLPERAKGRFAEIDAADVGRDLEHAQPELVIGALQFGEREVQVLQRHDRRAHQPRRIGTDGLGNRVVITAREIERDIGTPTRSA
jgi:hypothetical protein